KKYPDVVLVADGAGIADELDDELGAAAIEDCPQTVVRLRRELAQARAVIAAQQLVIRGHQRETTALKAKLAEIFALMSIPNKWLSYSAKCLAVVLDNVFEAT